MSVNAAGALSYLAGFITAIIFMIIDPYKRDPFVRFHAFQSLFFNLVWIAFWIVWTILGLVLSAVTKGIFFFIQTPIDLLIMLGGFCLWAFLMYSAYQGRRFPHSCDRRTRRQTGRAVMNAARMREVLQVATGPTSPGCWSKCW